MELSANENFYACDALLEALVLVASHQPMGSLTNNCGVCFLMSVPCRESQQATSCSLSGSCRLPACCCCQQQCWARLRHQQQLPLQHCLQRCSQLPLTASGDLAQTVCGAHSALPLSQTASSVSQAAGLHPLAVLTARLASSALSMAPAAQHAQPAHSGKQSKSDSLSAS
jgi:hypothetical protein